MDARETPPEGTRAPWLLLIHQLPPQPAYFRVKIWRRLQAMGAVAVKGTVYALPLDDQTQEDLQWLVREIIGAGGEAALCEARFVDGLSDQQLRALFDAARDADYQAIVKEAGALAEEVEAQPERRAEARKQLARLRRQLTQIEGIDFFGANGREAAEGVLSALEARLAEPGPDTGPKEDTMSGNELRTLHGRTWVTREGVHVDRIASAWLIRRFIDPEARFAFVPSKGHAARPGELRFDMYEADFTHESDRCTFEVLLERAALDDPALRAIGEIVHDIDLEDAKFGGEETAGIAGLIGGIVLAHRDDEQRLVRGAAADDDLHEYFRNTRVSPVLENEMHHAGGVQARPSMPADHGIALREAFWVWTKIALLSFGGPAGQIAVMHRILVEEKRWIGENRFLHALNYCVLLPGPEAQQLAVYIGWLLHRTWGGLVAGTLFVLPGLVSIMALSWLHAGLGDIGVVEATFFGLKAAVLAIVLEAVVRIGRRALENGVMVALAPPPSSPFSSSTCLFPHRSGRRADRRYGRSRRPALFPRRRWPPQTGRCDRRGWRIGARRDHA